MDKRGQEWSPRAVWICVCISAYAFVCVDNEIYMCMYENVWTQWTERWWELKVGESDWRRVEFVE